jgi:hypothetical protein
MTIEELSKTTGYPVEVVEYLLEQGLLDDESGDFVLDDEDDLLDFEEPAGVDSGTTEQGEEA